MPKHHSTPAATRLYVPPVSEILGQRSAWGSFLGHFCGNYYWFFLLTWLPSYLVRQMGFTLDGMATVGSLAYLAIAVSTIAAGWISDRAIASGISPTRVRKTIVVGGLLGSTSILPVAAMENRTLALVLLFLACMSFGVYVSNHWAITQTLSGPLAAGRWTSIQNGVGNLSGIAAPWLTGVVVERTGNFSLAFFVSAAVAFTGALMWGIVVGPVREVRWRTKSETPAEA
jgi:cyanate permease